MFVYNRHFTVFNSCVIRPQDKSEGCVPVVLWFNTGYNCARSVFPLFSPATEGG